MLYLNQGCDKMKPGVGVGVMILKNDQVLLGLRNSNKEKASSELNGEGTWTMPGGKVEFHETLEEAAKREVEEETSLKVQSLKVISITDDFTPEKHYVTIGFLTTDFLGEPKTMEEEILKWEWFNIHDLPTNMYLPSKKLIEKYLNNEKIY